MTDVSIIAAVGSDASGFRSFKDTPSPRPLGLSLNVSGDRLAVALSDHRLRVCSRGKDLASEWELLDEWRAHDAEILDASLIRIQWFDCIHGQFLGSVGLDFKFKLWKQAPSHTRGRRYRCIYTHVTQDHVPYDAFDIVPHRKDVFVGLMSHTGLFSLLEPSDPNNLSAWRETFSFYPFDRQHRSGLPKFDVSLCKGVQLLAGGPSGDADEVRFSFAISHECAVHIYQAIENSDGKMTCREATQFEVKDVWIDQIAWARGLQPESVNLSLLCDDHMIQLVQVSASKRCSVSTSLNDAVSQHETAPSGTVNGSNEAKRSSNPSSVDANACELSITMKEVLKHEDESAIVRMDWSMDGSVLMTASVDGNVRFWKESLDGQWVEYAEGSFS